VEIFRQGGRYTIAKVCGIALASALVLTIGSSYLGLSPLFLRTLALSLLSFFGGYLGIASLVLLYVVATIGIACSIIAAFHAWQWASRRMRRTSRVATR
jgi:hypothetical protein